MSWMWRRKNVVGGVAVGVLAATAVIVGTVGGPEDVVMPDMGPDGRGSGAVVLDLQAPRDFGALAPRGTGAGQWCGPLTRGGADFPAHCWELQQSTGDATDTGAVGGWHLSPQGSPRAGVATGLPVEGGAAVDWTSELTMHADNAGRYQATVTASASDLVTVSMVALLLPDTDLHPVVSRGGFASTPGWRIALVSNSLVIFAHDGTSSKTAIANTTMADSAWHCVTAVIDTRTANAAKFYVDGVDDTSATNDLSGLGTLAATNVMAIGGQGGTTSYYTGGVARTRIEYVAGTLAQHRALCGSWGLSLKASHRAANDTTWTQSGGARCYPASATTATCYPGGAPAATWDEDRVGPPVTNRIASNTGQQLDCAGAAWTCVGVASTVPGQTDPMGGITATTVTVAGGANHFEQDAIPGYTNDASPLNLVVWAKCSTGVFHPHGDNTGARGDWDVDCTCIGGAWRKLTAGDACVTENVPFNASATGTSGFHIDGTGFPASLDLWAPTLTEEANTTAMPTGSEPRTIGAGLAGPWTWATDAQGAVNRTLFSTAVDCTNWTCRGTGTVSATGQVAPDGSATASTITVASAGNDILGLASGYGNDAVVYPSFWVKCTAGELMLQSVAGGTGTWAVDCTAASAGQWTLVRSASQAGVTESAPWVASASGNSQPRFRAASGTVTADIWALTITEEPTTGAVIPTAAAAVDTGTIAWLVDNASSRYGVATSTYTSVLDTIDGTCLETGSTIRLSGGSGTECVGAWESLQVRR